MKESPVSFSVERPLRWGVIGAGSVCEVKSVPAYMGCPEFEVVAVMGRHAERVSDYANRHGIPRWTTKADDIVLDPEIDAVYIATPPDSHGPYALQVARAGKICCLEKPMAPGYRESFAIFEAFADRNLPLFVSYYRRSLPRFLQVKAWLEQERIGKVRHIHWQKTKPPSPWDLEGVPQWRTDIRVAPGGYFDDLASHGLDLFNFLLGDIVEARGKVENRQQLYSAPDTISADWLHPGGISGTGQWDFGARERVDRVEIQGSGGSIRFSVLDEAPLVLEGPHGQEVYGIPNPRHVQQHHVENIRDHLLGQGTHPSTGRTALHTAWVMDRILAVPGSVGEDHRVAP